MAKDSFRMRVVNGVALTADRYSFIVPTTGIKELNVHWRNTATGTPVGVLKFQVSNDPQAEADMWTEQQTASALGASATSVWVTLTTPTTVHGTGLNVNGANATDVAFVLGLGAYFRVWFDFTSDGAASSATCDVDCKG